MTIAAHLARIHERIAAAAARAGRRPDEITLVAVSKTFPAAAIREAHAAGVRHFGENRVQEWESKAAALADLRDATWHLVGHLQSNKARRAVELFTAIDSVDSIGLAQRLDRLVAESAAVVGAGFVGAGLQTGPRHKEVGAPLAAPASPRRLPILIEVRLAPEETKHGVAPAGLPAVAEAVRALPHLDLRGLMCIPPWCENPEDARPYFRRLRQLRDAWRARLDSTGECHPEPRPYWGEGPQGLGTEASTEPPRVTLPELSMGMSHDFEVAIEEGATQVRLGTALFGARG